MTKAKIPYFDCKSAILSELRSAARRGMPIQYAQLSASLGGRPPAIGPWKPILDFLSKEETDAGRPDVTFLAINKKYSAPGQIGFEAAKPPTAKQRLEYETVQQAVFDFYQNGGGKNLK